MMSKVAAVIRTAVIVPLFFLFTLATAAAVVATATVRKDSPVIDRLIRGWSRMFLLAAGARLEIDGSDLVDPAGQYVFLANHLSNLDIPVMFLAARVPIRYLAKKEVYKIPIVASAMRAIGIVRVDREGGSAIHAEVNRGVADARRRGHSLIIFPEATRSRTGELRTFKKGAFRIAISNDLPVVPVTIYGTWQIWPPGSKLFYPGEIKAVVHDPIPTADLDLADLESLRDRVRGIISKSFDELHAAV